MAKYDWEAIRAEYEAGATQSELARKHGVSRKAIQNHIEAGGWSQDIEPALNRKVAEKVAGVVAGSDPKKKAEALDAAAQRRADVEIRHQTEWEEHKQLVDTAIGNGDFDAAKLAKITAETLKIRQEGERKAWRLDSQPPVAQAPSNSVLVSAMTAEQFKSAAKDLLSEI